MRAHKTFPLQGGRCPSGHTGADEGRPVKRISPSFYPTPPHPSGLWPSTFPPEGGKVLGCTAFARGATTRRAKPRPESIIFLLRARTGETHSKPISFSRRKKKRFLESKEKGAPVRVKWLQIGIRRPGFTPPLRSSTVHRRLRRWNRDRPWFYPTFFRRLGRRVSGRGAAAWYTSIVGCGSVSFTYSLFTVTSYFSLWGATTRRATAPPFKHVILRRSIHSPVLYAARAQRSGSCCEKTSKGAECVFAVRRKQNKADFANRGPRESAQRFSGEKTTRGARP